MPRAFSMSCQSETTPRRPVLPLMCPASLMAWACRASASVSVDLPASGWLMTANVRRDRASRATSPADADPVAAVPAPVVGLATVTRR